MKPLLSGTAATRALHPGNAGHTPLPPRWASATQGGPELLAAPFVGEQRHPLRTKRDRSVKKEAAAAAIYPNALIHSSTINTLITQQTVINQRTAPGPQRDATLRLLPQPCPTSASEPLLEPPDTPGPPVHLDPHSTWEEAFSTGWGETQLLPRVPWARKDPARPLWGPVWSDTPTTEPGQPMARQAVSLLCDYRQVTPPSCGRKAERLWPRRTKLGFTCVEPRSAPGT